MGSGREIEYVEIDVSVLAETSKAWQVTDGKVTEWVPKSQCELSDDEKIITMPSWMAEQKGFA